MSKRRNLSQSVQSANGSLGPAAADVDHGAIVALAYELWLGRGCPIGTPEVDWFRAEELLKIQADFATVAPVQAEVPAKPSTEQATLAATGGA